MSYQEAVDHLDSLGVDAMKKLAPSTHRIEALCDLLNNPERHVPAIHITGTNGKTSTARFATSMLAAAGLSVGTYTSPHLQSVRERITLGNEPLPESVFGDVFEHVKPYVEVVESNLAERISYFEILTAMFFLWAAETVDAVVVEVGMGGRWDATNVLPSSVPVVTNVGLDHTAMLGPDRVTIAKEKVGIVKPGATVVTAERAPDVLAILEEGGPAARIGREFDVIDNRVALGGRYLSLRSGSRSYEGLFLPIHGAHQGVNAATALEAVARFVPARELDQEIVADGLAGARVPGRLETLRLEGLDAPVLLDVAHNPDGMSAAITSIIEAFAFERVVFVLGVLRDKDYDGMLAEIARVESLVITTEARNARSVPGHELARSAASRGIASEVVKGVDQAIGRAREIAGSKGLICITGSHYVVGEARDVLLPSEAQLTQTGER